MQSKGRVFGAINGDEILMVEKSENMKDHCRGKERFQNCGDSFLILLHKGKIHEL